MRAFSIAILVLLSNQSFGQDSTACSCSFTFSLKYPSKAENNRISGQVIIEMDRGQNCLLSNPLIKKGLGYGCDEEALRIVKLFINSENTCLQKCGRGKCSETKVIQTVTFQLNTE